MSKNPIGKITFYQDDDGELMLLQNFNPTEMSQSIRDRVVRELRDIANRINRDQFECDGQWEHFPPKETE